MGDNFIPGDVSNLLYLEELENEKSNKLYKEKAHQHLVDLLKVGFVPGFIREHKFAYNKALEKFIFYYEYQNRKKVSFEAFSSEPKNNEVIHLIKKQGEINIENTDITTLPKNKKTKSSI